MVVVDENETKEQRERGDLDDPKKVKRKEILSRLQERQIIEDFGWILSDPRGRRFVWKLMEEFQVFGNCFTGNNSTFYMLGERAAGLKLMMLINNHYPEAYLKMLQESKKAEMQ